MIVHMIYFHLRGYFQISNQIGKLEDFILFFFMPWFFFKAGFFWKENTIENVIRQGYKRLIKPFIIFSIIGHLLYCVQLYIEKDYYWGHYILSPFKALLRYGCVIGNEPLWFLLSLFIIRILYTLIKNYKISFFLVIILCLLIGSTCNYLDITEPRYLGNVATGLLFYSVGNLWQGYRDIFNKTIYFVLLLLCTIFLYFIYPSAIDSFYNKTIYGNYFIWIIHSILCIISINYLFSKLPPIKFFQNIGKNSMPYYIVHRVIIFTIQDIFLLIGLSTTGLTPFIWSTIMCFILLPISAKYIKL